MEPLPPLCVPRSLLNRLQLMKYLLQMWEHFTSKPYLSETRFVGNVPTPWSSWMIVASPQLRVAYSAVLKSFLSNLSASIEAFDTPLARSTSSKEFIIKTFGYRQEDVQSWFDQVTYPAHGVEAVEKNTIEKTLKILQAAGVLEAPEQGWNLDDFVDTSFARLI